MTADHVPWAALLPVLDALDELGVEHHVGGSVASSLLAVSRATQDVDLVADLEPEHAERLVSLLGPDYYADAEAIADAIRRRASFNVIHLPSMFKVDVFVAGRDAFTRQNIARVVTLDVEEIGRTLRVCSPEDIVLHKLAWYRDGGEVADRQWHDALAVLKLHAETLDRDYLRDWAGQLGLHQLLGRALRESGPED